MDEDINNMIDQTPLLTKMKVSVRMRIAARIMDLLGESGLTKSEFASKIGKQPSEITKWLSGTHNFTIETLCEIAIALDVEPYNLLNFKSTKGNPNV